MSSGRGRRTTIAVALAALLPVATAAIAFQGRRSAEEKAQSEQGRTAALELRQAELAALPPREVPKPTGFRLAPAADLAATLQTLQALCDGANVTVEQLQAIPGRAPGKQPFQLVGHGAPSAVATMLAGIERTEQLLIVESGRFLPAEGGRVAFDFGIAMYHEEARR